MLKIWSKNIEVTQSCMKNIDFTGGVDELLLATVYKLLNQGLRQKTGGIYSKYVSKILAKSNMSYLLSRW
jgi:hypothetical protein